MPPAGIQDPRLPGRNQYTTAGMGPRRTLPAPQDRSPPAAAGRARGAVTSRSADGASRGKPFVDGDRGGGER
jgi:hypothetical protein